MTMQAKIAQVKKMSKEESNALKEKRREIALKNLGARNLSNLATSYVVESDPSFGEHDRGSVEQFLYGPSLRRADAHDLKSGKEFSLVYNSLLGSRQGGKRYSGNVSEYKIIETAAAITQESIGAVKVEDLMSLMGSKLSIKEAYKGRYVSDLLNSKAKVEKKLAQTLISGYMLHIGTQGASKALGLRDKAISGDLEKLVGEEKKK
ncbi:MAG: hypothetical protein AABX79_02095 [Nanoarchaeota archaeon]